jgi:hypothetical protein
MKKLKFLFFPTILALAFGLMLSCSKSSEDNFNETVADTNDAINDGVGNTNDNLEDILEDNNDTALDLEDAITGGGDSSDTATEDISFDPSSVPDNATTVAFGQSYQYQVGTSGTYSGTITYSLSNEPDNMTISSSGLVQWTPTKASEIKTHSDITITLTTASGYVLTLTYDLTVTGTCVSGNVLAIWSGDQRTSTDSSNLLGNVTAYTDNSSSVKTASQNYNYHSSSVHLTHGPTPTATTGNVFFYNQYNNTTHLYFFYMFGVEGNSVANTVKIDVFTSNNTSASSDIVDDGEGGGETHRTSQSLTDGLYSSSYKSRNAYNNANSDGAVIGPFTGAEFRIFVDLGGTSTIDSQTLTLGSLASFKYYSKDGTSFALGAVDNFTVGYNTTLDCSN